MRYEGNIYRPPSEAYSLIIQATVGCAHNKCSFCTMYKDKKFRIRPLDDIFQDLSMARRHYSKVQRIFLADGNALVMKTEQLAAILEKIKILFPECERVTCYASASDVLRKSLDELILLKNLGLAMVYIGVESGSDDILVEIKKDASSEAMVEAGSRVKAAGMKLSAMLISGLGGKEKTESHARESARVINDMNPDYLGLLTLGVYPDTEMYDRVSRGEMTLLEPMDILKEARMLIDGLDLENCVLRSNHVSNYINLSGVLGRDKENLLSQLDKVVNSHIELGIKTHRL
ncbi:MAG: radical SAM protein [Clostridiaceae bacterium]